MPVTERKRTPKDRPQNYAPARWTDELEELLLRRLAAMACEYDDVELSQAMIDEVNKRQAEITRAFCKERGLDRPQITLVASFGFGILPPQYKA